MSVKPILQAKPPGKFDLARFEPMVEPFTVRVEKQRGSMRFEIPLPPSDGNPPGIGWSKEQVREIQTWLVNEWSGGGHYVISIVDSSSPPLTMEWAAYYNPQEFAEKTPPLLAAGAAAPQPPNVTPINQARPMATFPGGGALPPASFFQTQQPQSYFPPSVPMPVQAQPPQYAYPPGYAMPPGYVDPERRALEQRLAYAEQEAQKAREQAAQREFERREAAARAENDRRFQEVQAMITNLGQQLVQRQQAPAGPDPAIVELREQNRQLQERLQRQLEDAERARRENELRDQIAKSQEDTRRMIEAMTQRYEALAREAAARGPDPMLAMFQQQMQMQIQAMKDMAHSNQSQFDRMQALMMRPQDVLSLAKESTSGADSRMADLNRTWQDIFGVQRQLIETAAQLNQGGSEVIGLIRDGVGSVKEMVEKYAGGKTREAVATVQANAQVAQAQAEVIKSQNDRLAEMARMEAAVKNGTAVQRPDGSFVAPGAPVQAGIPAAIGGLNGAPMNGNGTQVRPPWQKSAAPAPQSQAAQPVAEAKTEPAKTDGTYDPNRKIKGRTDQDWFSVLLPKVIELREGVAMFIESVNAKPPRVDKMGQLVGIYPQQVAQAVEQAGLYIMQNQLPIPAMVDLLIQGMVADFMDVLLPDAPQKYRDEVAAMLSGEVDPDADDDDDSDDDEDADDDDNKVEAQGGKAKAAPTAPAQA